MAGVFGANWPDRGVAVYPQERQREGIAAAKQRGAYTGRRPALTPEQAHQLCERAAAGEPKSALARQFGISRETVYSYLRAQPIAAPAGDRA
jgi:DNA invertase Pin-like site-specific DNA recombinase